MNRGESFVSDLSCWLVAAVFVLGLLHLAVRLRDVQVTDAADYDYAKARQSVRRVQTAGVRGRILDRNGKFLAENRRSVSIVCDAVAFQRRTWTDTMASITLAVERVSAKVGRPSRLEERTISRHLSQSLAMPLVVWRDIDFGLLARFAEHEREFPGFRLQETEERTYPNGSLAAHLVGYVGRDRGEAEAGDEKFNFYCPEMRGRAGLEAYYDSYLRGVSGEANVLVDARGFAIREWTVVESRPGLDLRLTLDVDVQAAVERELRGCRGACVVLDPRNGDVLALASAPTFDPNDFVPILTHEQYARYADDPAKPLLNRASGGAYAPGSTFKPVTALAGLFAGLPAAEEYDCSGVYVCGKMRLHCARRWGHGLLDMRHALRESCNAYFCHLGTQVGTNALFTAARTLGLGSKTGLDLGADTAGVVPSAEWKRNVYNEPWYPGDLPQTSIGQGMLLASPLQMALVAGAVGTGYRVTPHLKVGLASARRPLPYSAAQLKVVRDGMRMVVDGGTGRRGGEGVAVSVSGKTGTAEVGIGERRRKNTWFIAYAPSAMPTVAVAMVIENGESGGATTAPKVRNVLAQIFGSK